MATSNLSSTIFASTRVRYDLFQCCTMSHHVYSCHSLTSELLSNTIGALKTIGIRSSLAIVSIHVYTLNIYNAIYFHHIFYFYIIFFFKYIYIYLYMFENKSYQRYERLIINHTIPEVHRDSRTRCLVSFKTHMTKSVKSVYCFPTLYVPQVKVQVKSLLYECLSIVTKIVSFCRTRTHRCYQKLYVVT